MGPFEVIQNKLRSFIRKFCLNELLKGSLLFIVIGLVYFLLLLFIEHFLWLDSFGREILFWGFVWVEVVLLIRFVLIPVLRLLKVSKSLSEEEASAIVGKHFPEINDKLLNILQLKRNGQESDLLLASIEQKSKELQPFKFTTAVNFRENIRFLKYAAIPVVVVFLVLITGNSRLFADSLNRVVNYEKAFEPPAAFHFEVLNSSLQVLEGEAFQLAVATEGRIVPENVSIQYNGQVFYLESPSPGRFEHNFEALRKDMDFQLSANKVQSEPMQIEVLRVPRMQNFEVLLDYPSYTGIEDELLQGTGNAEVPEGTKVEWRLKARATEAVEMVLPDSSFYFYRHSDIFTLDKDLYADLDYRITTSNEEVKDYETLDYKIEVIKDEYPEIHVEGKKDSLDQESWYFYGMVSDDYRVRKIDLVYYLRETPEELQRIEITGDGVGVAEFFASFPDTLQLKAGVAYELFFEVFDNDGLNNSKSARSDIFSFRRKSDREVLEMRDENQKEAIKGMEEVLGELDSSEERLAEVLESYKEKGQLSRNERKKLQALIEARKKRNQAMMRQMEKFRKSLEQIEEDGEGEREPGLENNIREEEEELRRDEELLQELEKLTQKLNQEGLAEKLEQVSRRKRNQERSLEQLIELTRRYYIEERIGRVGEELFRLAKRQKELAGEKNMSKEIQDSIGQAFDEIQRNLEVIDRENKNLKKPVKLGRDKESEEGIKKELKEASENLEEEKMGEARENQEDAAKKMMELSKKMREERQTASMELLRTDAKSLRQVLDNLIIFSFEQEELLATFRNMGRGTRFFGNKLKRQDQLLENFQHIDDSLYSLALRNPVISNDITDVLEDIDYNLERALERLSQNQVGRGMGSQQYVVTNSNELALMLNGILSKLRNMMNGTPKPNGAGGGMQLSDIIIEQKKLSNDMEEGMEKFRENEERKSGGKGEEESGELYELFQEQQMLREALKKEMEELGMGDDMKELEKEMQEMEEDILRNGFSRDNLERMRRMEQKLLDLEDADLEQEESKERESLSSDKEYDNSTKVHIPRAKEYFNRNEILNRQILPLRRIYKKKVKEYFEGRNN